jgi:trehalose/maltose hydrolase-like predicted phosphorylase
LIANGLLSVVVHFPYASHTISGSDYTRDDDHTSILATGENNQYVIKLSMDSSRYEVHIGTCMQCCVQQTSQHAFEITSSNLVLQASFLFKQEAGNCTVSSFAQAKALSANHWARFWTEGAFIDFSLSSDERSKELQRRMLLSRYLLAIQCSGETPPPETGLTCNSWYGKFHLEMHLLHASHFALFNQAELLERSLHWYAGILDGAYERARVQGYRGARWPKMTDPSGNDSPSSIGTLLCWQQPHPIFYASLLRKTHPESALLKEWTEIIEATAAFMVDYLQYDEKQDLYVLGPPLIPVQENHRPEETLNPTFELSYWRWALQEAVSLLKEADRSVDEHWLQVLEKLSPLPNDAEVYLAHQHCPDTYGAFAYDHPSLLFSLGLLDGRDVDRRMMNNSLDRVLKDWKLNELWGWDFPLMAMTAARLGRSADAVDLLLMDSPKNTYTPNGHNAQLPKADLP